MRWIQTKRVKSCGKRAIGKGGPLGGIMWGSAADEQRVYVANSDLGFLPGGTMSLDPAAGGGLFALDLATGKVSMHVPPVPCGDRSQCSPALSAAVTAIPGVVFSGGVSGYLRAYATPDARLLWEFDTARDFATSERRFSSRRCDGRTRPDDRRRDALRRFGLRPMGWFVWQYSVGLRSQESLIRRSIDVSDGVDAASQYRLLAPLRHAERP